MDSCDRGCEVTNDGDLCNKKLDDGSKALLKAALGSMLAVVGLAGAEGAFATSTMPTIEVTATPSDPGGGHTISPCPNAATTTKVHANGLCGSNPPPPPPGGGGGGTVTLAEITVTAKSFDCKISGMNYTNVEYLAVIYVNSSGALALSSIATNNGGSVTINMAQLGVPSGTAQSMVHNHPINVYGNVPQNYVPSKADWQSYNNLKNAGNPVQGLYLYGPDNKLRYFDGSNQNYPGTYQYPSSGGPLPSTTTTVVSSGSGC